MADATETETRTTETATNRPALERRALSVDEAAQILGVNPWTVRRACYRGEIRSFKVGDRLLVVRDSIERLLTGGTGDDE